LKNEDPTSIELFEKHFSEAKANARPDR
jgi:hypothetical protein